MTIITAAALILHPLLLYLSYLVLGTVSASPTTVTVYRLFTLIENPPSFTELRTCHGLDGAGDVSLGCR